MIQQQMKTPDLHHTRADGCTVLVELAKCLATGRPAPQPLIDSFVSRLAQVTDAQVGTLDAAFGRIWAPGTKLHNVREQKRLRQAVHRAVWALKVAEPDLPMGRAFFKRIGALKGIHKSAGQAQRIYYDAVKAGAVNVAVLTKKSHVRAPVMRLSSHTAPAPAPSL